MAELTAPMTLRILTPGGSAGEAACDSVLLRIPDDVNGQGGGLVGIRRDHAPAVFALAEGAVEASLGGRPVLRASTPGGFASVRDNIITVLTDSAVPEDLPSEGS